MGAALKNLFEPLCIVSAFTIGTLINRRRTPKVYYHDDTESASSVASSPNLKPLLAPVEHVERRSPNVFFRLLSRFFNAFPFLVEIWYWNLTYWVYQLLRACSAKMIAGNEAVFARALGHSVQIVNVERTLGVYFEQRFQHFVLTEYPWAVKILANIYYSHITVGVSFLIYTYTFLPAPLFQRIRRTIAMDNAIAFVIVTLWRCYPPRMMPQEYGFVDVLHGKDGGGNAWTNNSFQLTIAAMPSLHFGTSLFFAVCLCRFSPHKLVRLLAPLWPTAMLITIVSTANHFLADAAIGALVPLLGWRINHLWLRLLPAYNWVFSPLTKRLDTVGGPREVVVRSYHD